MSQRIRRVVLWLRQWFFPGCWVSWSGLKDGEELSIGDAGDSFALPSQSEGALWIGVMGVALCKGTLRESPLKIFYRRGSERYLASMEFVVGRKYHCDLERLQVVYDGGYLDFMKVQG